MSTKSSDSFLPEEWQGPTMNLVFINLIFYLLTSIISGSVLSTGPEAIYLLGISIDSLLEFRLWTPFTSIFVHASIAHIGFNLIFLMVFGFKLEERGFKDKTIYLAYVLTGVVAGIVSHLFILDNSDISIGSSGAVFGFLGINAGIEKRERTTAYRSILFLSVILFISSSGPNTNVFAHLFGLIFGFMLGNSEFFDKYNQPSYDHLR